jgi:nucleotide-binding universal stress UspA family protein
MSDYRRVLIPIDLRPGRQMMAAAVRRIVDTSDAEITLLHVVESEPWMGRAGQTLRLMNEMETLAYRRFRGARLVRRIAWGRPADCILRSVREDRPDVVLLAAGGASLGAHPLGPVASEVLAEAPCPVLLEWTINAPVNHARVQPVCCAVTPDGGEARLLREAVVLAERCAAPLVLICGAEWRDHVTELRDRFAPGAAIHAAVGPASSMIARALRLHGAGLLLAGASREALLAAECQCPVLYEGPARQQRQHVPQLAERRIA